jgi:hypothetical protein
MPQLIEAATEYWRFSQHYASLKTNEERAQFVEYVVVPAASRAYDPKHKSLLYGLVQRAA